jgi:hypothetical protein
MSFLKKLHNKYKFLFQPKIFLFISVFVLFLSRYALLGTSAHFLGDEARDLLRMKQIFDNRQITLVGPISEDNLSIQSSLTYYMLLPFAVLLNFNPLGPVIGTGFYNIISILILAYLLKKHFHWPVYLAIIFLIPIFPLLQIGRWAWNPNLIPFWQSLSLLFISLGFSKLKPYWWFAAGIAQGLAIHNHWYSFFALLGFGLIILITSLKRKKYYEIILFLLGSFAAILPFILFDLRHPPGLFITRFIYFSPFASTGALTFDLGSLLTRFISILNQFYNYFAQINFPESWLSLFATLYFVFVIIKKNNLKILLFVAFILFFTFLTLTNTRIFDHYLIPAIIIWILIIMIPDYQESFSKFQILILLFFFTISLKPAYNEITSNTWDRNIDRVNKIAEIINANINGRRCNLFVPASPDTFGLGKRYRELVRVKGSQVLEWDDYRNYECLFVITTSNLEIIKNDPSYELDLIRNKKPTMEWKIDSSLWILYKFNL